MTVEISVQGIITASALLAAILALAGYIFRARDWFKKQDAQDSKIEALAKHHEDDMHESREERQLIVYALFGCLNGLQQLGCNSKVTEAAAKVEKYVNQKAHEK